MSESLTPTPPSSGKLAGIIGTAVVLGLLYLGREVLIPVTLAVLLSLFIAPLIRRLRQLGLGQTLSIWMAVGLLCIALSAVGMLIGSQVLRIAGDLPRYEQTIRDKLQTVSELTLGRVGALSDRAGRVFNQFAAEHNNVLERPAAAEAALKSGREPVPVEVQEPAPKPIELLRAIVASVWPPLQTAGIVLVVMIFVLLEREALRDRLIRLLGSGDLRATTVAVNDAGERLSRFFVSQFAVNFSVGLLVWLGLQLLGLPHATLWGAMAAVLRFVPYVGVWIAAVCATLLAAAISPGWTLCVYVFAWFFAVEMLISQWLEPRLYAHSTGLSPLSVVIAAIFWSWLWGPVGLVVSTPLTLCLVVAGRYIPALKALEILLGEVRALTLAQGFYQRALSGDEREILAGAREFLKRKAFADYCDTVLMPALHLARHDLEAGAISTEERLRLRRLVTSVISQLGDDGRNGRKLGAVSLLEEMSMAQQLRAQREQQFGRWQGPLQVPDGSVVLSMGLGGASSALAAEVLVRVLRGQHLDARHVALPDLDTPPPGQSDARAIALICLVSTEPEHEFAEAQAAIERLRARFSCARLLSVVLDSPFEQDGAPQIGTMGCERVAHSFQGALTLSLAALEQHPAPDAARSLTQL